MITTITSATTTAVSTATAASLVLIAVLTFLVLLIQKEIVGGLESLRAKQLSRALNVAIVPLLVVFVVNIVLKIVDLLH